MSLVDDIGMSAIELIPVLSPTQVLHAVRAGVLATACGLDTQRTRRRAQNGQLGWLRIKSSFEQAAERPGRPVCRRCVECLASGMGPGLAVRQR